MVQAISSLKINLKKGELILIGKVANVKDLAIELGCRVGNLSFTDLGLPLNAPFKVDLVWD